MHICDQPRSTHVQSWDEIDDNLGRAGETERNTQPRSSGRKPKPAGEPGWPSSGGYALDQTLLDVEKWAKETYDDILIALHKEADKVLDKSISFRAQNQESVDKICLKMSKRWEFLSSYKNCWPVCDMLKLHLKYTSEAS
ncbi:hypothetical protein BD779DRAFT_1685866 [Infundibulicybe gibba]|nr:hypothetical protein BD779DRAFT_1685866 [Infundibulicybe gibba]